MSRFLTKCNCQISLNESIPDEPEAKLSLSADTADLLESVAEYVQDGDLADALRRLAKHRK